MAANTKEMEEFEYQLQQSQTMATQQAAQESNTPQTYTDPSDGTVYEWDHSKRGWFPKIDGMFLAAYHSSYGYHNPNEAVTTSSDPANSSLPVVSMPLTDNVAVPAKRDSTSSNKSAEDEELPEAKKQKQPSTPGWFDIDEDHNTNVYVSGLHLDTTEDEFIELMTKCGIIMNDDNGSPKVKLYQDSEGNFKGDALCCFLKIESVALSIQLLDDSTFKGQTIHIEKAKFQMKGTYNPSLKRRKKPNKKKKGNTQERLLDWREGRSGPAKSKFDRIVVFKHLFDPSDFDDDPTLINEIKDDLRDECSKLGEVKKVLIFDRNEEGVASVAFKDFEAADQCILAMNGRFYGGKQLVVEKWDGITNYEIEETEQERLRRLKQWESFLEKKAEDKTGSGEGEAPPQPTGDVSTTTTSQPPMSLSSLSS